jgi:ABC-type sugar transport system substrate-binding protein
MKRSIVLLLAVAAVVTVGLAGCVPGAAPPTTPTPAAPAAPTPAAPTAPTPAAPTAPTPAAPTHAPGEAWFPPENPYEGLAIKPDGTPYTIADAHLFAGNDWNITACGIAKSLILRTGATYLFNDADLKAENQIAFLEDVVATHSADAVLIHPCDTRLLIPAADACAAAGIPVYCYCTDIWTDTLASLTHFDWTGETTGRGANLLGEFYIQKAQELGKHMYVYELWGDHGLQTSLERHQGFHIATDARPDLVTVIESADTFWSDDVISDFVADAFSTHPELNGFYCHGTGIGGIEALRGLGRVVPRDDPNHVWSSSVDCETLTIQYMKNGEFDAIANHGPWPMIDLELNFLLWNVVIGKEIDGQKELLFPVTVITPENEATATFGGASCTYEGLPYRDWDQWPVLNWEKELGFKTPTVADRKNALGY